MAKNNSFAKVARSIRSAVNSGSRKALNQALDETHKKMLADLKGQTGFPTAYIKDRVRKLKATTKLPKAKIYATFKLGISMADPIFKATPRQMRVTVKGAHSKYGVIKRNYKMTATGATAKVGNLSRAIVATGFLRTVRGGKELMLARAGKSRYKTVSLTTDMFRKAVIAQEKPARDYLSNTFHKLVNDAITTAFTNALKTGDSE